jgi:hypothetical protein
VGSKRTDWFPWALPILQGHHEDGDILLSHIVPVANDEFRDLFVNIETKERSPNKPKNFKETSSVFQKADVNCFLRQKRSAHSGLQAKKKKTTMTSQVYCETKNFIGPFRTKGV